MPFDVCMQQGVDASVQYTIHMVGEWIFSVRLCALLSVKTLTMQRTAILA